MGLVCDMVMDEDGGHWARCRSQLSWECKSQLENWSGPGCCQHSTLRWIIDQPGAFFRLFPPIKIDACKTPQCLCVSMLNWGVTMILTTGYHGASRITLKQCLNFWQQPSRGNNWSKPWHIPSYNYPYRGLLLADKPLWLLQWLNDERGANKLA